MARKKKPRGQKRTPKKIVWTAAFLAALRETGNIRLACESAKVVRSVAYIKRSTDAAFSAEWDVALEEAADDLEQEARRRARNGVRRLKFHQGELIEVQARDAKGRLVVDAKGQPVMVPYEEHEYSDTLLIFLLKAARPEKFRDNHKIDLSAAITGAVSHVTEVVVRTREEAAALLDQQEAETNAAKQ